MRISCGLFLSYICCCSVTLVGTKGCKIRGDAHKPWGAPGWCVVCVTIHVSISQLCLLTSEAHPRSWRTLGSLTRWTSLLQLLCQSWGCCPREKGCFFIGRGVTATVVVVFTPLRRVLGSERGFERSRSSSAPNARREWGGSCGARAPLLRRERVGPGGGDTGWEKRTQPLRHPRAVPAQGQSLNPARVLGPVRSRGKVLITWLIISERLSVLTCAVPFVRGKTIKQADMNNLLACLDDSCQDQQSHVIYLSTCVISFFFLKKKHSCKCPWHFRWYLNGFNQ